MAKSVAKSGDLGGARGYFPLRLPLEPLGDVGSNPSLSAKGRFKPIQMRLLGSPTTGALDAVRAAYNRSDYLPERRRMMVAWANYLDEAERGAKVIALRAGGADA